MHGKSGWAALQNLPPSRAFLIVRIRPIPALHGNPDWPATCVVNGNVTASMPGRSGAEAPFAQVSRMYSGRWNEAGEGWSCCNGQAGYAPWAIPAGSLETGAASCRSSRSWEQVCLRCLQTSKR